MRLQVTLSLLLVVLFALPALAQKPAATPSSIPEPRRFKPIPLNEIDLYEIGHINPDERFQDYDKGGDPKFTAISRSVVSYGTKAIPWLISKLDDPRVYEEQRIDFWSGMTVGDMAFVGLTNLMVEPDGRKACVEGYDFDGFLGRNGPNESSVNLYYGYIEKNGRAAIKKRWVKFWSYNRNRLYMDYKARCFRLK